MVYVLTFVLLMICCSNLLSSSPIAVDEKNLSLPDYHFLEEEFLLSLETAVNHLVHSRDMHRLLKRNKRQLNNIGGAGGLGQGGLGAFGQGSNGFGSLLNGLNGLNGISGLNGAAGGQGVLGAGGALGQGVGTLFDGLENFANIASLQALGAGAGSNLGPLSPVLQGIGTANNVVKTVVDLDRMRCMPRLACEYMANRGLLNRTGAIISPAVVSALPNSTQAAFNISNPSTFRSVLGILQLIRVQEFGAYPYLEAGLWGAAHRDHTRCRNQFTKCPSTSEAFISELNSTPGGLQSMFTNAIQSLRNALPGAASSAGAGAAVAAQPTRITSGVQGSNLGNFANLGGSLANFGQQGLNSINSLGSLGSNFAGQQSSNSINSLGSLGNNIAGQQFFNPSSSLLTGSSFNRPTSSSVLNGVGGIGSLASIGAGTNFNQFNLNAIGTNGANLGAFGQNGLFAGTQFAGSQLGSLNSAQLGTLSSAQLGSLSGNNIGSFQGSLSNLPLNSFSGSSFASPGVNNFNFLNTPVGSSLPSLSSSLFQTSNGLGGINGINSNFRIGLDHKSAPKVETGKKWKWSI